VNLRELALRLSAITVIADAAKDAKDQLRAQYADALNEIGADSAKALVDGTEVAKVSLVSPKPSPIVINEDSFLKWVEENADASNIVRTIRDSYRKHVLDNIVEIDGKAVYATTGEVVDFVIMKSRESYVSTRFSTGGRDVIVEAIRNHTIDMTSLIDVSAPAELEASA
jgi:ribosomal protein S16